MKVNQCELFTAILQHLGDRGVPALDVPTFGRVLDATNEIVAAVDEMPEQDFVVETQCPEGGAKQ